MSRACSPCPTFNVTSASRMIVMTFAFRGGGAVAGSGMSMASTFRFVPFEGGSSLVVVVFSDILERVCGKRSVYCWLRRRSSKLDTQKMGSARVK